MADNIGSDELFAKVLTSLEWSECVEVWHRDT